MSARTMESLKEKICDELDELAEKVIREGKINMSDIQKVGELVDIKKNMLKVEMLEDGSYSQAGDWEAMGRGHFGDYDRGNSYAGRHRDSMGRYSRDGGDYSRARGGRRGYSRDGGESFMDHIDMMLDEAATPEERETIKRFKKELERLK